MLSSDQLVGTPTERIIVTMIAGNTHTRRVRRTLATLAALFAVGALVATAAFAAVDQLGNGAISESRGPYRSTLNRVFVHDQNGAGACENAENTNGNSVQERDGCTTGSIYHDFCGCATRRGVIHGPPQVGGGGFATEYMDGHQDY
jgi:hypothetical protein